MRESREYIFFLEKCINLTLFNQRLPALGVGGVIKFTLYCLLTLEMLHIKFITDLLGSFKMKMLTHERRRMSHVQDGRRWKQPISIGHLSSNDSKKCKKFSHSSAFLQTINSFLRRDMFTAFIKDISYSTSFAKLSLDRTVPCDWNASYKTW